MKKTLGAILIIAALAGLYFGVSNIRAVISERTKLENEFDERSARLESTAGMLKKLDSDRDEYLDYLKDVSEGEEDLVDGEDDLADAETEYAARISDKEIAKLMTGKKLKKQPGLAQSGELIKQSLTGEEGAAGLMMAEMLSGEKKLSKSISDADSYPEFDRAWQCLTVCGPGCLLNCNK